MQRWHSVLQLLYVDQVLQTGRCDFYVSTPLKLRSHAHAQAHTTCTLYWWPSCISYWSCCSSTILTVLLYSFAVLKTCVDGAGVSMTLLSPARGHCHRSTGQSPCQFADVVRSISMHTLLCWLTLHCSVVICQIRAGTVLFTPAPSTSGRADAAGQGDTAVSAYS